MDNYIVSARKYRPATFQTLVGQSNLAQTLKNAINSNKLAHAYLFCGPRGVGKTSCARIFAKTINCLNPSHDGEACNECESCVSFNEQRSYNIHELDAASNNGVDNIKDLISQVMIPPQIGKYKIFIIDEVHMLSTAAFNAFLKTLEEPPRHVVFILATTEKHKILPTILSRCQIYDFNRINIGNISEHLAFVANNEGVNFEPAALNVIAQKADGGMRDALSIFDQIVSFTGGNLTYKSVIENLNVLDFEYFFKITDALVNADVTTSLLILNDVITRGFDPQHFINGLSSHLRNVMVSKDTATLSLVEGGTELAKRYAVQAAKCTNQFLYKSLELANDCDINYKASRNKRLLTEITLIKISQINITPATPVQTQGMMSGAFNNAQNGVSGNQQPMNSGVQQQQYVSATVAENKAVYSNDRQPANQASGVQNQPQPNVAQPSAQTTNKVQQSLPQNDVKSATAPKRRAVMPDISIDLNPQKEKVVEQKTSYGERLSNSFTYEMLLAAWREYIKLIPTKTILVNTMKSCLPQLHEGYQVSVWVENRAQVMDLQNESTDLIPYLRKTLSNSYININIFETEKGENKKFLSPKEKYKEMVDENPDLVYLKETFNLEMA